MLGRFIKNTVPSFMVLAIFVQPVFLSGQEKDLAAAGGVSGAGFAEIFPAQALPGVFSGEELFGKNPDNETYPVAQEVNDEVVGPADAAEIAPQTVAPQAAVPKVAAPKRIAPKAKGLSCIKIPANILARLKGAPTPPDGKMKDGKLICHVLAEGKKDNPHKSSRNPKGQWGGCCYDPDEVPNPRCCYPVGSVYEKPLNDYFKNPFPLRK